MIEVERETNDTDEDNTTRIDVKTEKAKETTDSKSIINTPE